MYGQLLTREQVLDMIAPRAVVTNAVISWIQKVASTFNHQYKIQNNRDAIVVTSPVELVEALFETEMFVFRRPHSKTIKHLGSLSVPEHLNEHIQIITGITEFPPHNRHSPIPKSEHSYIDFQDSNSQCNVPYTLKKVYNMPEDLVITNKKATQGPYAEMQSEDGTDGFGANDCSLWQTANSISQNPIKCILGNAAQDYTPEDTDDEANLDIQMLTGFAVNAPTCFWLMSVDHGWMYEFSQEIFLNPNASLVNSISYSWYETQQCQTPDLQVEGMGNCTTLHIPNSQDYIARTEIEFQKLGAVGHTLLVASVDDGVQSPDNCNTMGPEYPSTSAFVVSVGATAIVDNSTDVIVIGKDAPKICTDSSYQCDCSTSKDEQSAMSNNTAQFDSGGGFSFYVPIPAYQKAAVEQYIKSGVKLPPKNTWNSSNRAFPDVALCGGNIAVIDGGSVQMVGGTSASTPMFGAMITALNQDRLNAGKSPLGFINPVLYKLATQYPTAFQDITIGTNGGGCSNLQFEATSGWDPLTGLGSPNFGVIRQYISSLP